MVKVNCSSCGTELERSKKYPVYTCFLCKQKRKLEYAKMVRLGKTKQISTIS